MKGFSNACTKLLPKFRQGKVATYGQIAALLGAARNARIVGWAMHKAPPS